ncbi:MAG: hypothetical protein JSS96_02620 [Bacteroidetes bacterium]|nr:hypothetical protein [Bacteroidota bacterium]
MNIKELLNDKTQKPKEKTELLSRAIVTGEINIEVLLDFAKAAKDSDKATCIEALEFATKENATVANRAIFQFAIASLSSKAPRVKWESAKVIGNTAKLFEKDLGDAIAGLLQNTEDKGTVVRWSAAFALGEIIKLKTKHNKELIPATEAIMEREEKNSIKKIYQAAFKKAKL